MTIAGATYREGVAYSPDGAMYVTPTGTASITAGTITGTPVPYSVGTSSIPIIGLSSGSVSAAGAISAITALPLAYPHAFCYFPANILATVKAAGFYYCTFSTTTAGTAFLDSWTGTSPPTIPSSPTPVTDGKGAFTGDTTEQGVILPIAAGALGPNGMIRGFVHTANNNSAGTKTLRLRFSGASGQDYLGNSQTTNTVSAWDFVVANDGVANTKQIGRARGIVGASTAASTSDALSTGAVDTTAATDFRITLQRNTATDNAIIQAYQVLVSYGA